MIATYLVYLINIMFAVAIVRFDEKKNERRAELAYLMCPNALQPSSTTSGTASGNAASDGLRACSHARAQSMPRPATNSSRDCASR